MGRKRTGYWASNVNLNAPQADMFFSPSSGIGLEYIRTTNTPDGSMPDLPTVKLAVARGAKVIVDVRTTSIYDVEWSHSPQMRVTCSPEDYGSYATYIVKLDTDIASRTASTLMFSPPRIRPNTGAQLDRRAVRHVHQSKSGSSFCICWSHHRHHYRRRLIIGSIRIL